MGMDCLMAMWQTRQHSPHSTRNMLMDEFGLKRQPQVVDGENGIRRKLKMFLVFIKVTFF